MTRVLVTGGTGRLGSHLVPLLRKAGHQVTIMSRTAGEGRVVADLAGGAGVEAAVEGQEVVVHAASNGKPKVEVEGSAALAKAAAVAGVGHFIYVSIVGVDANPGRSRYRARPAARCVTAPRSRTGPSRWTPASAPGASGWRPGVEPSGEEAVSWAPWSSSYSSTGASARGLASADAPTLRAHGTEGFLLLARPGATIHPETHPETHPEPSRPRDGRPKGHRI